MLNAIPGMRCVAPRAAFYVLPSVALPPGKTDEEFVLALLRETGILCVNGSDPRELQSIYTDIGSFTRDYLQRG
jgi:aspartate/methionine/tyrosine aminotransferase